ncbi:hypothetical protein EJ110_NYTH54187 [Nymphaea thermarum]|nr:Haloacid dehalogenase-like hydrolase domain-containing protein [Nymphaea thermarum]KAF3773956.1 hypothetical protein EJ110_NYTH54187 [Nymphaea thermarum]
MNSLSRVLHWFRPSMAARFSTSGPRNLSPPKAKLRGVVFDMDGTLTVPVIDFSAMYRAVLGDDYASIKSSSSLGVDILQHIDSWSPDRQKKAYDIIADFEGRGLEQLQIMPGAKELCEFLDARQIRRGLITRNVKTAVDLFHLRFGMSFDPALSREFHPYKPDPAPLLSICSVWGVRPDEVIMVGDSLRDDVTCGRRAGAFTCLLDEKGKYASPDSFTDVRPDFRVSTLIEIYPLLEANFDLSL